jgi:hypothetical protein
MNSSTIGKSTRFNGILKQTAVSQRLLAAIPLFVISLALYSAVYSPPASANRPAVDESAGMDNETSENSTEAPSSVELMMQQQTRQSGDVLQLPAKEMQPGETIRIKLLDYPRRGMSMAKVQQEYGQPIAISDSVGNPPITRWTYQDRVVYFERSTVLHVVAR